MDATSIPPQPPRKPKKARKGIALELDLDTYKRLKHVAQLRKIPYQTMLKQFVAERVIEEEKRLKVDAL